MYGRQTFSGGVQARTVAGCTVRHPVVMTLDGVDTELTLADAKKLLDGLAAAVAAVDAAEEAIVAGEIGHRFVIGQSRYRMSCVPSKLRE